MIKDLSPGENYKGCVAVKECSAREGSNGIFLAMLVTDGDASIPARIWEHSGDAPKVDSVVYIESTLRLYKNERQLTINGWRQAEPGSYDPSQFIPTYPGSLEDLEAKLNSLISKIEDPDYLEVVNYIIKGEYKEEYRMAPAASKNHHAYLHGLLHHSVSVCERVLNMADDTVDKQLLITGALLHDAGKIMEYDWSGVVIKRTDYEKLLGNIVTGIMVVSEAIQMTGGMPYQKTVKLLHLITSHHGRPEWGSPIQPLMKEAFILHQADLMDARLFSINKACDGVAEGWSNKVAGVGQEFFVG